MHILVAGSVCSCRFRLQIADPASPYGVGRFRFKQVSFAFVTNRLSAPERAPVRFASYESPVCHLKLDFLPTPAAYSITTTPHHVTVITDCTIHERCPPLDNHSSDFPNKPAVSGNMVDQITSGLHRTGTYEYDCCLALPLSFQAADMDQNDRRVLCKMFND